MNQYEIKGENKFNGHRGTWKIIEENEEKLRKSYFGKGLNIESITLLESNVEWHSTMTPPNKKPIIPDAEALLYEMDVNECDTITLKGGFGKTHTYTREEVEASLGLR